MKHFIAILALIVGLPIAAQNYADSDTTQQSLQSRINATDAAESADSEASTTTQAVASTASDTHSGSANTLMIYALGVCSVIGLVVAVVATQKIKGLKQEKDNEITALKTAMQQRGEETEKRLRMLEDRLAAATVSHSRATAVSPRTIPTPHQQAPSAATPKKKASPTTVYLSRPDSEGRFLAQAARIEPGNSIFKLTTTDGKTGTFEVINDANVHQLALMMPTENLTRACTGHNIQVSAGMTTIVTDAPGEAVNDGSRWRIAKQAVIHYE